MLRPVPQRRYRKGVTTVPEVTVEEMLPKVTTGAAHQGRFDRVQRLVRIQQPCTAHARY